MSAVDDHHYHHEVHLHRNGITLNMKLLVVKTATVAILLTVVALARGFQGHMLRFGVLLPASFRGVSFYINSQASMDLWKGM